MATQQIAEDMVRVHLVGASGPVDLAAQTIARYFDIPARRAETVLSEGSGLLADHLSRAAVRAALPMLSALGIRLAVYESDAPAETEKFDLSIRLTNGYHAARLIRTLHRLVGAGNLPSYWFDGPQGMVLEGLTRAKVDWIAAAIRPLSGVQITASPSGNARYELYCTIETDAMDMAGLQRHLTLLGVVPGGVGDALACDLDRHALDHVLTRFGMSGVFGVNQDFARFDVLVGGRGSLSQSEFTDFLITRTGCTPNMARAISVANPIRIESCLTRAAARQFIGDYAQIGLPAFARLVRN